MTGTLSITPLPPMTRLSVRGGEAAVATIGAAFGVALPREACRAVEAGERAALWLGPDEWLLLATDGEAEALIAALTAALGGATASLVDISDRQVALEVAGDGAVEAINGFNALDLDEAAFPVGMCTRTLFGKAEIVLWRKAADIFHIEVWRSFAPYLSGCLDEAIRERGAVAG
jgi:sarcosine oxidase, subunit gamma